MEREGNTLSGVIRQAWDTGNLRTLTRNNPLKATDAHISIIGNITQDELRRYLTRTERANGFANRFLWILARRSQCLPFGGNLSEEELSPLQERFARAVAFARDASVITFSADARNLWRQVYVRLSEGKRGLSGAIVSRGEAQTRRLACLFTLLDGSVVTTGHHLTAALAVWEYAEASARFIFGQAIGDPVADAILAELQKRPEAGLTRTEISGLFRGNKEAEQIRQALTALAELGLCHPVQVESPGGGRPAERWFVSGTATKETKELRQLSETTSYFV